MQWILGKDLANAAAEPVVSTEERKDMKNKRYFERLRAQDGYWLNIPGLLVAALLTIGFAFHGSVRAQKAAPPGWYWLNTAKKNLPDCIPLDEDPMSSLSRTFGRADMRLIDRWDSPEGRVVIIEVDTKNGPSQFAYATTQPACKSLKTKLASMESAEEVSPVLKVSPAALQALPKNYEGKVVQFKVQVLGGLSPNGPGESRVYIDDYSHLTPILQGAVLRRWLEAGFSPNRVYTVTFRGRVRSRSRGDFVDFDVDDFRRE